MGRRSRSLTADYQYGNYNNNPYGGNGGGRYVKTRLTPSSPAPTTEWEEVVTHGRKLTRFVSGVTAPILSTTET